jgi:hypothetical protein
VAPSQAHSFRRKPESRFCEFTAQHRGYRLEFILSIAEGPV